MPIADLALAAAILSVACAIQAAVGFGANLIAAPVLVLINPEFVPGPLVGVGVVLTLLMVLREPERARTRHLVLALGGRIPGNVLGAVALLAVAEDDLSLLVGVIVLVAVALSASGLHIPPTDPAVFGAGVASGFSGTTASIGGPPMALLYQRETGPTLRGTLARLLFYGAVLSLVTLLVIGRYDGTDAVATLALLPGVALGWALSPPLARRLDRGYTRVAVLSLSAAAAVGAVVKALA